MKAIFFLLTLSSFVFISCNESGEKIHVKTVKGETNKKAEKKVMANAQLNIEISGMSCEKGCGGTIRKALKQTGGVERVSYDFVEGRETQIAKISLDSTKIDVDKIKKIISKLNENQFSTGKFEWSPLN